MAYEQDVLIDRDGNSHKRRTDYIDDLGELSEISGKCCDCGEKCGNLHHLGCDAEPCPICGGQLISCGCFPQIKQ
ncbi:hypothetical protein ES703_15784 [subsurface metagenome]